MFVDVLLLNFFMCLFLMLVWSLFVCVFVELSLSVLEMNFSVFLRLVLDDVLLSVVCVML